MTTIFTLSYAIAALAFLGLTLLLARGLGQRRALRGLFWASLACVVWAAGVVALVQRQAALPDWLVPSDALHSAIWLAFLAWLLPPGRQLSLRHLLAVAAVLVLAITWLPAAGLPLPPMAWLAPLTLYLLLAATLLALVAIEQLYRNAEHAERRVLAPLCLGLGGLFAYELFVYSSALLLGALDLRLWAARGLVNAAVVPLLALAGLRHPEWSSRFYVSRQMVFYSATLVGAGAYLLAMAVGGYVIRQRGGEWGPVLQVGFLAAALLLLGAILFSSQFIARLRVFIDKHFFRSRYDYRQEWLRLIRTLSARDGGSAAERALRALADILQSPTGELWVSPAQGEPYVCAATLGHVPGAPPVAPWPPGHPVTEFLAETQWIVDTDEYRDDPERYGHAFRALAEGELPKGSVIVPLRHDGRLLGLARLDRIPGRGPLNYEDHDLLKTVGRQSAVFLAQELAREQLAETRQFEAFNRTTAFLMHDLKNLMAQQALIVQNAPRHRHKPEFIDDALRTVERSVARMKQLLEQLQRGAGPTSPPATRVNLTPIVEEVVAEAARRRPAPSLQIDGYCEVRGDRDRLHMAVSHTVRNAQEATPADGEVRVHLRREGGEIVIEVSDTGSGMDEVFIRERLFRPFDTTKGAAGMGIGAYQVREILKSLGGRVEVESAPGRGTRLRLVMPAPAATAAPPAQGQMHA